MENQPPKPADALMQYDEQWKHIASPGHVLLARVNAYQYKTALIAWLISAAIFALIFAAIVPPMIGYAIGTPVGKAIGLVQSLFSPSEPDKSPAPTLKSISIQIPDTLTDASSYPDLSVIANAMTGAAEQIKNGKGIEGCDTTSKITDVWSTETSAQPKCRMSADKSRLWVWGAALKSNSYGAYFVLLRKDQDTITTYNIIVPEQRTMIIGEHTRKNTQLIPRALAADFPELSK